MLFEQSFYSKTRAKTHKLIQAGFWGGINQSRFNTWCEEFQTNEEEILLAFLLDSLVYRSNGQITGLIQQMIDVNLSSSIDWKNSIDVNDRYETLFDLLSDKYPRNLHQTISLVPVIKISDPPTKSGPLLARIISKHKVNTKFMCWPWDTERLHNPSLKVVVFFDDFVGTGDQFVDFFTYFNSMNSFENSNNVQYIYIAFSGTQEGISLIEQKTDHKVKVYVTELIKESSKFFSGFPIRYNKLDKYIDISVQEYAHNLQQTYIEFVERKGIRNEIFGYNNLELTHIFSHGTPNGTLPIFWCSNQTYIAPFTR